MAVRCTAHSPSTSRSCARSIVCAGEQSAHECLRPSRGRLRARLDEAEPRLAEHAPRAAHREHARALHDRMPRLWLRGRASSNRRAFLHPVPLPCPCRMGASRQGRRPAQRSVDRHARRAGGHGRDACEGRDRASGVEVRLLVAGGAWRDVPDGREAPRGGREEARTVRLHGARRGGDGARRRGALVPRSLPRAGDRIVRATRVRCTQRSWPSAGRACSRGAVVERPASWTLSRPAVTGRARAACRDDFFGVPCRLRRSARH